MKVTTGFMISALTLAASSPGALAAPVSPQPNVASPDLARSPPASPLPPSCAHSAAKATKQMRRQVGPASNALPPISLTGLGLGGLGGGATGGLPVVGNVVGSVGQVVTGLEGTVTSVLDSTLGTLDNLLSPILGGLPIVGPTLKQTVDQATHTVSDAIHKILGQLTPDQLASVQRQLNAQLGQATPAVAVPVAAPKAAAAAATGDPVAALTSLLQQAGVAPSAITGLVGGVTGAAAGGAAANPLGALTGVVGGVTGGAGATDPTAVIAGLLSQAGGLGAVTQSGPAAQVSSILQQAGLGSIASNPTAVAGLVSNPGALLGLLTGPHQFAKSVAPTSTADSSSSSSSPTTSQASTLNPIAPLDGVAHVPTSVPAAAHAFAADHVLATGASIPTAAPIAALPSGMAQLRKSTSASASASASASSSSSAPAPSATATASVDSASLHNGAQAFYPARVFLEDAASTPETRVPRWSPSLEAIFERGVTDGTVDGDGDDAAAAAAGASSAADDAELYGYTVGDEDPAATAFEDSLGERDLIPDDGDLYDDGDYDFDDSASAFEDAPEFPVAAPVAAPAAL